eukprot:scaffold37404_cov72-Attheya_sp.AAC.1
MILQILHSNTPKAFQYYTTAMNHPHHGGSSMEQENDGYAMFLISGGMKKIEMDEEHRKSHSVLPSRLSLAGHSFAQMVVAPLAFL